jgi:hypothetical protein
MIILMDLGFLLKKKIKIALIKIKIILIKIINIKI